MKMYVIIGLPGSGKTFLGKQLSVEKKIHFFDDVSKHNSIKAMEEYVQTKEDFIIADPLLCFPDAKRNFDNWVKNNASSYVVKYIYFENDPESCLENVEIRDDGRDVENFIKSARKVYDPPFGARKVYGKKKKMKQILSDLRMLRDKEREEIFSHFCTHCGSTDIGCQCWNDE